MKTETDFVYNIWYFAGLITDLGKNNMMRRVIAGEPIVLGLTQGGDAFALRDICLHRAAPFSSGQIIQDTVECPYHGWRFDVKNGACTHIPALTKDQTLETERIKLRRFPVRVHGPMIWIYIADPDGPQQEPMIDPPHIIGARGRPRMDDAIVLNCHVDHGVIGLMDPAHGPFVHRQWWWRSERSIHEKQKAFEPRERGFAMIRHTPSSNSFAYKLLGGKPQTEIIFALPGIRTEHIQVGKKFVLSFTAVTPIDQDRTHIRQIFFTDMILLKFLAPFLGGFSRRFLRQDGDMVDLQQMGLRYNPNLMLIDDADTQAKWYYGLKKNWKAAKGNPRNFQNPVKARILKWRS